MDFSQYGKASEEWTSYVSAHPIIDQAWSKPDQSLAEMYATGTAFRAAQDRERLKASGLDGTFITQDHNAIARSGESIPLRVYTPNGTSPAKRRPVYVYFHGGGFLHGSVETEVTICASIATKLNMMVIHPCPRHIHEAKHLTQHHDAWDALVWILDHAGALGGDLNNLVIGGISSGANLAASVTQQFFASDKYHGDVRLKGQVLIVPWLIQPDLFPYHLFADVERTSLVQNSNALGLPSSRLKWLAGLVEKEDISGSLLNPALANDQVLRSLPKTAIIVAGGDPLRDDGLLYATRMKQAGVSTKIHVFSGMPHHFTVYELPHPHVGYDLPSAKIGQARLLESIQWILIDGHDKIDRAWNIESSSWL